LSFLGQKGRKNLNRHDREKKRMHGCHQTSSVGGERKKKDSNKGQPSFYISNRESTKKRREKLEGEVGKQWRKVRLEWLGVVTSRRGGESTAH